MKADFQYSNLLDRCLFEQIIPKILQVRVSLKILHAPSWGCHCLSNHITFWFWPLKSGNSQTIWVQCIIIRRKRTRLLTIPSHILPKSVQISVSVPLLWPRTPDAENAKCAKKAERRTRPEHHRLEGSQETPS
jgi:hypothetical protein